MIRRTVRRVQRASRYYAIRLVRLRAGRERIARGFAIGLVTNFLPTFGLGILFSGLLARGLGGNAIAGFIGALTLNFFWPLLFLLNVKVGELLLATIRSVEHVGHAASAQFSAAWGHAFTVGAALNCLLAGLVAYGVIFILHGSYQPRLLAHFQRQARITRG